MPCINFEASSPDRHWSVAIFWSMQTIARQPDPETDRILIVDDDDLVRRTLCRMLAASGYDVAEANGAEMALDLIAREGEFAMVLSDVHMPGQGGLLLLDRLRTEHPQTAVLMLTGDAEVATAVACLKQGAMDYLTKPVVLEELQARVDQALEKRRLRLEVAQLRESYQTDLERQVRELAYRNQRMFLGHVHMAVRMLEAKDAYTRGHSDRVATYAVATGRMMGFDGALLEEVRLGAELHDIGKVGTRDAVLNKPGPLDDEEFAEMRRHTTDGEEMLSVLRDEHPVVLQIVRSHHERMDGKGFPDNLVGGQIPLAARLVCVVDAFDAMTSSRAYREKCDHHTAFTELNRNRGVQFDPDIIDAFYRAFPTPDSNLIKT
jgi:putative nucleotidyltransferase with HDIG domain